MSCNEPIQPYDSDHTALVHVLWEAERGGITVSDADELAAHIIRSKWMRAVKQHAGKALRSDEARQAAHEAYLRGDMLDAINAAIRVAMPGKEAPS